MASLTPDRNSTTDRNRVPDVTLDFWMIKLLAVTVGETAADYLALNLGMWLANTAWIMSGFLIFTLVLQFAQRKYVPWAYWSTVVLISVVGTLITDNLVDNLDVPLEVTTIGCSAALALTFVVWYAVERTLSIHTIYTSRREVFYWLAILFTFALGTAAGDLAAEDLGMGYVRAGLMFGALILVTALAYYRLRMNGILAFWVAYILTRPVGASLGDFLSQPIEYGGLGLGTIITSLVFLICIGALVLYMTFRRDHGAILARGGRYPK